MVVELAEGSHPIVSAAISVRGLIGEVADLDPIFMSPAQQAAALRELVAAKAQLVELEARVLGAAQAHGGIEDAAGAHQVTAWLATETRIGQPAARAELKLAHGLEHRPLLAARMRAGAVTAEQATVVLRSLDRLPSETGPDVVAAAEAHLVELSARFDPRQLGVLGRRVLDVVAPEVAEAHEARALAAEERSAWERCRLTLLPQGDGTTRVRGLVPDLAAVRLARYLHALTSPRRVGSPHGAPPPECPDPALTEARESGGPMEEPPWWCLPHARKLGHAFCELLERIDPATLPEHGTTSTELVVTMTLQSLCADLGVASILSGDGLERISADEARRLACNAGILPAVLDGEGRVLDLGRRRRLASKAQKLALTLEHATCQARGCDKPAAWCEVHHLRPWSAGGRTDLRDLVLLCAADHRRIHDPAYSHDWLPDGSVRFPRRT